VLRAGETLSLLSAGFRPFENLKPQLDQWVAGELDQPAEEEKAGA